MVYKWKIPGLVPVDAQDAGEELDRIYRKNGQLNAKDVVDESRPVEAPLHNCFEWNDSVAAEKYRQSQAQEIIRQIVVTEDGDEQKTGSVRAFVSISREYHPIDVVIQHPDMREMMMRDALAELRAFHNKYETLSSLKPVFNAIDEAIKQNDREVS